MIEYLLEFTLFILGVLSTAVGFMGKRLFSKMDNTEKRVDKLESALHNHRVEDAAMYLPRKEHDDKMEVLKNDIRGMLSALTTSVRNIEQRLMDKK